MTTSIGVEFSDATVEQYVKSLVGQFYKILPIKESGSKSFSKYVKSFQRELIGCKSLVCAFNNDGQFLSLLSILQYLSDNDNCETAIVRVEVFKAIDICKKLQSRYFMNAGGAKDE